VNVIPPNPRGCGTATVAIAITNARVDMEFMEAMERQT
jgi:hypothetical protein